MRLLRAELRKLKRPLFWCVLGLSALFCVLLAIGAADNAHNDLINSERSPSCAELKLEPGSACATGQAMIRAREVSRRAETNVMAEHTAAQFQPVAMGAEAAGLMASMPGALALALLAGGHLGGEWSGRTMKNLLTQHGRRWQVLAAKFGSLWLAGTGLIAGCWAALAVTGPVVSRLFDLPDGHESFGAAARLAGSQCGRALVVLAVFVAIGMLAAVLARNALGATAGTVGVFLVLLITAELPTLGKWTPATWVEAWMGFRGPDRTLTDLPNSFWSRFTEAGGRLPGHWFGLLGLVATLAVCAILATRTFDRTDVAG